MASAKAIMLYKTAYPTINGLGTDAEEKGETPPIAATRGDCISKTNLFQRASEGMIKLEITPISTAV